MLYWSQSQSFRLAQAQLDSYAYVHVRFKNNVRTVRTIELWAQAQNQAINAKAIEVRRKLMIGSAFLANVRYMLSPVRLSSVCLSVTLVRRILRRLKLSAIFQRH